jgi:hypothetical protein
MFTTSTASGVNADERLVLLPDGQRIKLTDEQIERLYLAVLRDRIEGIR